MGNVVEYRVKLCGTDTDGEEALIISWSCNVADGVKMLIRSVSYVNTVGLFHVISFAQPFKA